MEMKLDHEIYLDLERKRRSREGNDDYKQKMARILRILLDLVMKALNLEGQTLA